MSYPAAPFRHLQRLTDNVGLLEHADGVVPRHEQGYCVDDAARGLVVVCREPSPSQELITLGRRYLYFLAQAQSPDGRFRNRLGYDRRWRDHPRAEDCWGRALWGLGTAAVRGATPGIREESLSRFGRGAQVSSAWPHAMAFAALGAAEILDCWHDHSAALTLLDKASAIIGQARADPAWPWPARRLTYANAAIAEAIIVAGSNLGRDRVLRDGLRMLEWLLTVETRDGHLSVVPAGGWGPGEDRPGFDQQPIEAQATISACIEAYQATGDAFWVTEARRVFEWFLGRNDLGLALYDPGTGGCRDGLHMDRLSQNQGAESTLAFLLSLAEMQALQNSLTSFEGPSGK